MKYSQYNSIIELNTKHALLYNALSDQYVVIKRPLEKAVKTKSPESLSQTYPQLYEEVRKGGGVVDSSTNEKEELRKRIIAVDQNDEEYTLIINPTLNCNFSCWYCYENHLKNSLMSEEIKSWVFKLIDCILEKQQNLKRFSLSFFGGEPLIAYTKVVEPIIKYFNKKCFAKKISFNTNFTSNGYLITPKMLDFFQQNQIASFQITLDGDRTEHNKVRFSAQTGESYDTIIQHIKLLLSRKITVILRINYTSQNITSFNHVIEEFTDLNPEQKEYLSINLQQIWQDRNRSENMVENIEELKKNFKEHGFHISRPDFNYTNHSCYADKRHQALVNYNGDVFKCTARDFLPQNRNGFLNEAGEIVWENNTLEKRMQVKLTNENCLNCRIAPLCGGGCIQNTLERDLTCSMDNDEKKKDDTILKHFISRFIPD